MEIKIQYSPHPKQIEVHNDSHQFRVIAAGRQAGKTTLAINELIRIALQSPKGRTWYVAPTYKQAKSIAWDDPKHGVFAFLPPEFIKRVYRSELSIHLTNQHIIEFKGAENKDKLRGAKLVFLVLDEFGHMESDIWAGILSPMLGVSKGRALFIGTPNSNGSSHFHDLYKMGQTNDPNWKSWLFLTKDNPYFSLEYINKMQRELPPDIFKREYEADFTIGEGLIYDNFNYGTHIIPSYEPKADDLVIGSIDPGLVNETAALLTAWDPHGVCRVFKEYYQKEFLADYNAREISNWAKPHKISFWIIDRACIRREPNGGPTVYDIYKKYVSPLHPAKNDPGSVNFGINEVKKLLQPNSVTKQPRLFISAELTNFINEIQHYSKYRPRFEMLQNPPDKPRKYRDHLMDCLRNIVFIRPWLLKGHFEPKHYATSHSTTGY